MMCVKTGCHLYSKEYGEYFSGDLYITNTETTYIFKGNAREREPLRPRLNAMADEVTIWSFGDGQMVIVVEVMQWTDYIGIPVKQLIDNHVIRG